MNRGFYCLSRAADVDKGRLWLTLMSLLCSSAPSSSMSFAWVTA